MAAIDVAAVTSIVLTNNAATQVDRVRNNELDISDLLGMGRLAVDRGLGRPLWGRARIATATPYPTTEW